MSIEFRIENNSHGSFVRLTDSYTYPSLFLTSTGKVVTSGVVENKEFYHKTQVDAEKALGKWLSRDRIDTVFRGSFVILAIPVDNGPRVIVASGDKLWERGRWSKDVAEIFPCEGPGLYRAVPAVTGQKQSPWSFDLKVTRDRGGYVARVINTKASLYSKEFTAGSWEDLKAQLVHLPLDLPAVEPEPLPEDPQ